MEDPNNYQDSGQMLSRERKEYNNRSSIISKYENSISNIKNQVYELKSKLQRPPTDIYNEVIPEENSFQAQSHHRSDYEIHQPPFEEVMNMNHRLEAELREARSEIEKKNGELIHMSEQINYLNRRVHTSKENISPNVNTDIIDKLRSKLDFLERQNADYIDKIARLENEMIIHRTQTSLPLTGEFSEGDSSSGPKFKIQKLELERIKLVESNEYLNEKVNQVQLAYNAMREQLDSNIQKYENLLEKVKDNEDDKHKYILHAKKLDEQLKSLNSNYTTLQKKVTSLENDNKVLNDELKLAEAEKRNFSEKWQKLSKKVKNDDAQKISLKALENEITDKTKEVEEFREKFVSAKTELQILRESERTYKDIIEAKSRELKDQQEKCDSALKDKEGLLKQNLELIERLERLEGELEHLRKVEMSYQEKEELNHLKSTINTFQMLAKKLELEKMELTKKYNESMVENEKLQKRKHEVEIGFEKAKNDVIFMNTKWNHLLREFEKLQAEHMRTLNNTQNEQDLLASLDKGFQAGRFEQEDILVTYDPMRDDSFLATRREIDKIRSIDETLYRAVDTMFNQYAASVKTKIECNDVSARYNRLLIKYYKMNERNKDLQRAQEFNDNIYEQANESMSHPSQNNSLCYSGPKGDQKVVGFASNHRKRSDSDPHIDHKNETLKLQKVQTEEGTTPVKYSFSSQKGNRNKSTDKKAGILRTSFNDSKHLQRQGPGAIGPIVQLNDFADHRGGRTPSSNLEEELKNEIMNAKTLKENTSLEKLGLRIVNKELESGPMRASTPLGNDRYLRILKNTLGGKQSEEPKRRGSAMVRGSMNVKSYMDMHQARRDQLNTSEIVNNSMTNLSGLNQSYNKPHMQVQIYIFPIYHVQVEDENQV